MARIHARKRGKHGSKKPIKDIPPSWLKYKTDEIKTLVLKLFNKELLPSKIGLYLRDVYGIPSVKVATGKRIVKLLKENKVKIDIPEDLFCLFKRAVKVRKHLEKSKNDLHSKRGLRLIESKILRLVKYYKRKKLLPEDWRYEPKEVELLVE